MGEASNGSRSRVVLVTGASSGIGRAAAILSASAGDRVALLARHQDSLDDVATECARAGALSTQVVAADVAEDAEVAAAVEAVLREHGRLDAVLHCAGVVTYGRTEDVDVEDFRAVLDTNLLGSVAVARHVIPQFRRQGAGVLVLVGSLLGHIAVPEMTPYVVSKWGVRALARQLAVENADVPDLRIAHVAPGSVDTPIYDHPLDEGAAVNAAPPPTISPERAARAVYRQIRHPQRESQTAWLNYPVIAAYRLAPGVWDRLAGPLFRSLSHHHKGAGDRPDHSGSRARAAGS